MEDNFTLELNKDELGLIQHYREQNKLHADFHPFNTYDMVQMGYPYPNHGAMVCRSCGGSDSNDHLLPSNGMWCKVEDALALIKKIETVVVVDRITNYLVKTKPKRYYKTDEKFLNPDGSNKRNPYYPNTV